MKNRKLFVAVIAVALIVALGVIGTIAWLLDSKTIDSTFTVGNVRLADLKQDGGYAFHLIPGSEYKIDPQVTVKGTSEEAYVRMFVTIADAADVIAVLGEDTDTDGVNDVFVFSDYVDFNSTDWEEMATSYTATAEDTIVIEIRYNGTVAESDADTPLDKAFTTFSVPSTLTNEDLAQFVDADGTLAINVVAQAIQRENLDTDDEAWAAFDAQDRS